MEKSVKLKNFFVNFFSVISKAEERAVSSFSNDELTPKEMHLITATCVTKEKKKNNFTNIAKLLGITLGTLTTSFNRLAKKGFLSKVPSLKDKRIYYIEPSENAVAMYHEFTNFHMKMVDGIVTTLEPAQLDILINSLEKLDTFFRKVKEEYKKERVR